MAFYDKAALLLKQLLEKKGTIKSLVYKDEKSTDKKRLLKVLCEFLKYKDAVDTIIENSDILVEKDLNLNLARIMVFEFLFAKGPSGNSKALLKHQTRLQAELTKLKLKSGALNNKDLIPELLRNQLNLPRYIRVNTNKTTVVAVLTHFTTLGFIDITNSTATSNIPTRSIKVDEHIPNLLVLPYSTDLHQDSLLLNGSIIIQDKASCFPAFILSPKPNSHVIDACAAPGNKTSHLSAIMKNKGHIFAFDADKRRLETLKSLTSRACCQNIEAIHGNFLEVDPLDKKYAKVESILLDPSCSGSGIIGRLDHLTEDTTTAPPPRKSTTPEKTTGRPTKKVKTVTEHDQSMTSNSAETQKERLDLLSEFQYKALIHAFSFPSVTKVVYSTCSKHTEENEDVVRRILEANKEFRLASGVFPPWTRRGLDFVDGYENLVRTLPEEDLTIGFFVALFERIQKPKKQKTIANEATM